MRLRDLNATLIWKLDARSGTFWRIDCPSIQEAQGLMFVCPKCFVTNKGFIGTHSVICWFRNRGVPDDMDPKPGRWTPSGTSIDDITFVPGVPPIAVSVQLLGGCNWHGFIVKGDASI